MVTVLPYKGVFPDIHESVFLADGSRIIGDVAIGGESSVWFNTVIRGDVCPIRIGRKTSVQDNAMLHVTHDTGPLTIGSRVTIGHGALLHACTVHDDVLIGIGSVILDHAVVEPYALVAAGAVVRQGFTVPSGMLVAGVPARVVRPINEHERKAIEESPDNYVRYVQNYRDGGYDGKYHGEVQ